jgi:uncharacterized protein YndB with AHSA1/START domain
MHTLQLRHEISIHALTTKVWKVLTCPDYTGQYLFEGELVSDWVKGGPLLLQVEREGRTEVMNKGQIHELVPGISLQFTLYEDGLGKEPVVFQYELVPEEGGIKLIFLQELVMKAEGLHKMLTEQARVLLQKIKWLAEYA